MNVFLTTWTTEDGLDLVLLILLLSRLFWCAQKTSLQRREAWSECFLPRVSRVCTCAELRGAQGVEGGAGGVAGAGGVWRFPDKLGKSLQQLSVCPVAVAT